MRRLDRLRADTDTFVEQLAREEGLSLSGRKAAPDLEKILEEFAPCYDRSAIAFVCDEWLRATDRVEAKRLRIFLGWLVWFGMMRDSAALMDRLGAWEATATVETGLDGAIPYGRVLKEIAHESDIDRRSRLYEARAQLLREMNPLRIELFERQRAFVTSLGIAPDYAGTWERLQGVSLTVVAKFATEILERTDVLWRELGDRAFRRSIGVDLATATWADALAFLQGPEFAFAFPADGVTEGVFANLRTMGLDPLAQGRIVVDDSEREGKTTRAGCGPIRVPHEVLVLIRPQSGHLGWRALLHEMGHALHFAHTDPSLPIEFRRFGDLAVTETYAALFDHLVHDRAWLLQHGTLGNKVDDFLRFAALEKLHYLRGHCGAILFQLRLFGESWDLSHACGQFADVMSRALGHRVCEAEAFTAVDGHFMAANYLRASILRPMLERQLVARSGVRWWSNADTGRWLSAELFRRGSSDSADELSHRLSGGGLSTDPLVQTVLAAFEQGS